MPQASSGICGDNAMITTLRHRLITMQGHHASQPILRRPSTGLRYCSAPPPVGMLTYPEPMKRYQMPQITNGMPTTQLRGVTWRKSRHSNPSGNCVELAELPLGGVAVRNSRHPSGPVLIYTRAELAAFVQSVKDVEFDEMMG